MAYEINKTDNSKLTDLADNTTSAVGGLTLIGQNLSQYGEILNENFVRLLENFANSTAPGDPLVGQLWYDTVNKTLKIRTESNIWETVGASTVSATAPANPANGDLWWSTSTGQRQLQIWSGSAWEIIGPEISLENPNTGVVVENILGNDDVNYTCLKLVVSNKTLIIFSSSTFTPLVPIPNFPSQIITGMNFRSSLDPGQISTGSLTITDTGITPRVDNTIDLGSSSKRFTAAYATTFNGNATSATTATTATSATTATTATNVNITTNADNTSKYIGFVDSTSGNREIKVDPEFTYNPNTDTLVVPKIVTSQIVASGATPIVVSATGQVSNLRAETASRWHTPRSIALTGDVTGTVTGVDGSGNISIATTIGTNRVALGAQTTGPYVASITAGSGIEVDSLTTGSGSTVQITNAGVTGLTGGTGISVSSSTGNVTINNTGVTSFNGSTGAIIFQPTTYTLSRGYNATGSLSRTVYLTAGSWVLTVLSNSIKSDSGINYSLQITQNVTVTTDTDPATVLATATATTAFEKTGTEGFGRIMYANAVARATFSIVTPGNYLLIIAQASETIGPNGGTGADQRGAAIATLEKQ